MVPTVRSLIAVDGALGQLAGFLGRGEMKPVRVLFFDKTPKVNWSAPWHQDRTIALKERVDAPGFGPWSVKDEIVHVEPPTALLENMLTLRLFLDDCGADNGPLEVACNTHTLGRVPSQDAAVLARQSRRFVAVGEAGDVLAMRLLALHKSDRATNPSRRRVLHVDYCGESLPAPLHWAGED
ncbi:MAG TPA: phytanoyl-CoA dioxygenase family protein [Roseiarcus sp.]|nr:phytanoyl-CoA dioxygenase family protein [Roseiarcus sp.]